MAQKNTRAKTDKKPKADRKKTAKTIADEIRVLQRQTWATDLKVQGLSYRRIAKRMKELELVPKSYSESTAFEDVKAAMARMMATQSELAMQNFYLDLRRYDEMFERIYPLALPKAEEGEMELPPDPVYFGAIMAILSTRERLFNYKTIFGTQEKKDPDYNVHLDLSVYTVEELLTIQKRIQSGEDAILVVSQIQEARKSADQTPA